MPLILDHPVAAISAAARRGHRDISACKPVTPGNDGVRPTGSRLRGVRRLALRASNCWMSAPVRSIDFDRSRAPSRPTWCLTPATSTLEALVRNDMESRRQCLHGCRAGRPLRRFCPPQLESRRICGFRSGQCKDRLVYTPGVSERTALYARPMKAPAGDLLVRGGGRAQPVFS